MWLGQEVVAEYWDRENRRTSGKPDYLHYILLQRLSGDIGNIEGKKIFDIGCGHGDLLSEFKKKSGYVYGIDIGRESLDVCREKGIPVVEADCRSLPFKDNAFDVVYSIGVVEHVRETSQAIREQIRVCRPGGLVVIIVPNRLSPFFILGFVYCLINRNYKYGLLATKGKSYTKKSLIRLFNPVTDIVSKKTMIWCSQEQDVDISSFYGSAFLKEIAKKFDKQLADKIEKSWFSRKFGHLLYAKLRIG